MLVPANLFLFCPHSTEDKPKAPVFTEPLKDTEGEDGQPLTLECLIEANPVPIIMWYKNQKVLRAGVEYKQTHEGDRVRLAIRELFPDDAGVYECMARNDVGKTSTSCKVSVKGKALNIYSVDKIHLSNLFMWSLFHEFSDKSGQIHEGTPTVQVIIHLDHWIFSSAISQYAGKCD